MAGSKLRRALPLWGMIILFLAGCGAAPAQPFAPGEPVWQAGEQSRYRVINVEGVYAGEALLTIDHSQRESLPDGWLITREIAANTSGESATIQITGRSYKPVYSEMARNLNGRRERVETLYNNGQVDITLITTQEVATTQRVSIATDARDEQTLPYVVRTLPLANRYATEFNSFLPVMGRMERVVLQVTGQEEVTTPLGLFTAWKVALDYTEGRRTEMWVSVDAPYPMVKFVDGRSGATFELMGFPQSGNP